jgi:hypothetical protein
MIMLLWIIYICSMQSEDFSPSADFNNYNDCSYIIQESGI